MIRTSDATLTQFHCDACDKSEHVYEHPEYAPMTPDGWVTWPEFSLDEESATLLLCPEHAHLKATLRLVATLLSKRESSVA